MANFFVYYAVGNDKTNEEYEAMIDEVISGNAINENFHKYVDSNLIDRKYGSQRYHHEPNSQRSALWESYQKVLTDERFAPLMAGDLTGIQPTLVFTCQHDALRDDGILYANRLRDANVKVTHINYANGFHGMAMFVIKPFVVKEGIETVKTIKAFLNGLE